MTSYKSAMIPELNMGQNIQEETKLNSWKTAFKKFEVIGSAYVTSNLLKAVFHKFHFVHSWIFCPI